MDADQSKIATKTDGGYYLSNYKGIEAIFKWLVDLVELISYGNNDDRCVIENSPIWDDIALYKATIMVTGREYIEKYSLFTKARFVEMDQAARVATVSEFVRIGWKIFGQAWRKDWYLEFFDKLCEEGEEGTISPKRDDVWTAIEALAQFYLSINESCRAYSISVITDDTLLMDFCNGKRSHIAQDDLRRFEENPITECRPKPGRRSCRSMILDDYFTTDPRCEITQILNFIKDNPGKSRSEALAIEIIRLKEEGKIIELNGRFSGFIDQLRTVIPDLPSRQSIIRYLQRT